MLIGEDLEDYARRSELMAHADFQQVNNKTLKFYKHQDFTVSNFTSK